MLRWMLPTLALGGLLLIGARPVHSCSLCGAALRQSPTFREESALETARVIIIGTAENPQLNPGGTTGTTDLRITDVLRSDPLLEGKKVIRVERYLPVSDPKN